jgi:hypothetical protein
MSLPQTDVQPTQALQTVAPITSITEGVSGGKLGEFVVLSEIGHGSFGRVFLCRQPAFDRLVAVKASWAERQGESEGVALGGLEHDHIVKVFSSFTDEATGWHCLCLQYVPGADLAAVIQQLHAHGSPQSGHDFLAALDEVSRGESGFDPAALRDREAIDRDDFAQAVCRLGAKLAEALAFAHARGILHCDVKPANILMTPYARPMLADFNVSFDGSQANAKRAGGTAAYMAPEQRNALLGVRGPPLDGRCDIFSLGIVLHELATGVRPALEPDRDPLDTVPRELAAVIRRCLEIETSNRYQSGTDLAAALNGARYLIGIRRALPAAGRVARWAEVRPVAALALFGLFPHFIASILNIAYNKVNIPLEGKQDEAFHKMILGYNLIAYPFCAFILFSLLSAIQKGMLQLRRLNGPQLDDLRRRVRRFGFWAMLLGMVGWLPGAVIFPLGIDALAGPVKAAVYFHFAVSFTLSGLVGVVFSYLTIEWVVFRVLLPRLGNPDDSPAAKMTEEVRPLTVPFGPFLVLACVVPLTGAILLISLADGTMSVGFRVLVALLIGLGASGVGIAERFTRRLSRLASVWENSGLSVERSGSADYSGRTASAH